MNKKLKKFLRIITLSLAVLGLFVFGISSLAGADENNPYNIPEPPESGPSMADNFTFAGKQPNEDVQKLYPNVQVVTDDDGSNGTDSSQAMWWKNKVDLTRPFTIKFYIYLKQDHPENPLGDGLTFTLQNDKSTSVGYSGESLGAYGNIRSASAKLSDQIGHSWPGLNSPTMNKAADDAYRNSGYINHAFSLEFDPYFNEDYSDHNVNDGNDIPHIAFMFPNQHGPVSNGSDYNWYHLSMNHLSPTREDSLRDNQGKWIPITYQWTPNNTPDKATGGKATVTYNDPKSGHSLPDVGSDTISQDVPLSQFNGKQAYWGFTGATGQQSMNSAIANTEIPQVPGVKKLVIDLSQQQRNGKYTNLNPTEKDPNDLIKQINPNDFNYKVTDAKVGDILLYKVDTYNYKDNGLGNTWENVLVTDDIDKLGMRSLDDNSQIVATYPNGVPPINEGDAPSTVGFRTVITDPTPTVKNNYVTAKGTNWQMPGNPDGVVRSSNAQVDMADNPYINKKPEIYLKNQMSADNGKNWSNNLSNLNNNSKVKYNAEIHNMLTGTQFNKGTYSFVVPSLKNVNSMKLTNETTNTTQNVNKGKPDKGNVYYETTDAKEGSDYNISGPVGDDNYKNATKVIVHLPGMKNRQAYNLSTDLTLGKNNPNNLTSTPKLQGKYPKNQDVSFDGQQDTYNFVTGSLTFSNIQNLDFGKQYGYFFKGNYLLPKFLENGNKSTPIDINKGYDIASLTDTRRAKNGYRVYLSQKEDSGNDKEIGSANSPFSLVYFNNNQAPVTLTPGNGEVELMNFAGSDSDSPVTSKIHWNKNRGLKLLMNQEGSADGKDGQYSATLTWNVKEGSNNSNKKQNKEQGTP